MSEKRLNIIRWIARLWSLLPVLFALGHLFEDDANATGEIYLTDYILLALLGIYVLGLILAWKWEYIAGLASTIIFAIFLILFAVFVTRADFMTYIVFIFGAFPPAAMFLFYGWQKRNQE